MNKALLLAFSIIFVSCNAIKLDYDYIDMLIRDELMLGKKGETTYIISDNES